MNNIAFLITNIDPSNGGSERVTYTIAQNLDKIGYCSYYIYTRLDYNKVDAKRKLKIGINDRAEQIADVLKQFVIQNDIKVIVVVNRVFQTKNYLTAFSIVKNETDVKFIISLHASPDNWVNKNKFSLVLTKDYIKQGIKALLYKLYNPNMVQVVNSYKVADKYLLLSKSYIKSFEETYHIKDYEHKLMAMPNPCPFYDSYDGTSRENIVLIVGRMVEDQKRIFVAIKIWEKLYQDFPNWKLVIVGDGPDLSIYKKKAQHIGNIYFEGHSNEVQKFYKKSKVFMMTSIWEGLPMTLIEAMHYGCVPIAFDSFAALHDLIIDGKTGYIIPNNDICHFTNQLKTLLNDNSKIEEISNKILQSPNMFELNNIIKLWDCELKELIEN